MCLHITISNIVIIFLIIINVFLFFVLMYILQKHNKGNIEKNDIADYVSNLVQIINSVRYGNLVSRLGKHPDKNLNNVSKCINRMIETLNDREKMIIEYQNELKTRNELKSAIINSLSDGLVIFDNHNKIIQTSENIKEWFKEQQVVNKSLNKYIKIADEKLFSKLEDDEIFIANLDKKFEATTVKLDSNTYQNRYLLIIKDVTSLREIDTLKEDFIATLTHDLKVPIIAESNMLNFLLANKFGKISDKQREVIENMQKSNKELLDLVHIVLDTYKIKDKGIILNKEDKNLSQVILNVVQEIYPTAQVTNNKLITNVPENIVYNIDSIQLSRVLKNLIQNAILYGKSDSDILINLKKSKDIQILVKNYGKGISKEDINKIFDKYYSASKKFRKIGTGLGLYLSKEIVNAHGGTLTVYSEEGKYTEFCISLPAEK